MGRLSPLNYEQIKLDFLKELVQASTNHPSSISFIKHTFPTKPLLTSGLAQAIVIGGTNYEVATVEINHKTITVINHSKGKVPTFKTETVFLDFIKQHFNPNAKALAINFAYKLNPIRGPFGEVDGILQNGTKEHTFKRLINKQLGQTIRQALKIDIPITVVNDTVCLGTNSLIVGSGFNICFDNSNLEAGNFNNFEIPEDVVFLDKRSVSPGKYPFEKTIAGTYLPFHYQFWAKKFHIKTTFFRHPELDSGSHEMPKPRLNRGKQVRHDSFEIDSGETLSQLALTDKTEAGDLARFLLTRSASLVGAALAALYECNKRKPLTFITEGSVFWHGWEYEKNVQKQLMLLHIPNEAVTFKQISDNSLQGALSLLSRTT